MSFIKVKGVKYQYHSSREIAVKNININIESGEFISIIGANGSGKSTLARLFNGLLIPTEGDVCVAGLNTKNRDNIRNIRTKVGMIFQNPDNQIVAATVEDDVAFGLENLAVSSSIIKEKVEHALKQVGMEDSHKSPPHQLSGGQKQRIAIAGVIAMEPSCIVLDEPTAMLDPQGREHVLQIVKELNEKKEITIVYITHFMEEAIKADRILVMNEGKIVKNNVPRNIFKDIEFLSEINLDVPVVVELANNLRELGISLPEVLTIDELVNDLC